MACEAGRQSTRPRRPSHPHYLDVAKARAFDRRHAIAYEGHEPSRSRRTSGAASVEQPKFFARSDTTLHGIDPAEASIGSKYPGEAALRLPCISNRASLGRIKHMMSTLTGQQRFNGSKLTRKFTSVRLFRTERSCIGSEATREINSANVKSAVAEQETE
jgi:hypothetical protein